MSVIVKDVRVVLHFEVPWPVDSHVHCWEFHRALIVEWGEPLATMLARRDFKWVEKPILFRSLPRVGNELV